MQTDIALTWSWLGILTKRRYDLLIAQYKDMGTALNAVNESLLQQLGCRDETILRVLTRLDEFDPAQYARELAKRDLILLSMEDDDYPAALHNLPDPPVFLMYRGDLSVLAQPCVGMVGTRAISSYGQRVTETITADLVRAGIVTVSGLALGIDAAVARETITQGGKTVAVLAHGLANLFPKSNAQLGAEIVAAGGLILSEFPLDAMPDKYAFPARNRIIAGLSLATVVLEAGDESGALITAELALEYGRDVFAVPGHIFDPNYAGCHKLIATGQARLIQSASDVLQEIGIVAPETTARPSYVPRGEEEAILLAVLTSMPQSVSDLVERAGLDTGTVNAALTMMELAGGAKNAGAGMWVRR